jgi:hypothetical protein
MTEHVVDFPLFHHQQQASASSNTNNNVALYTGSVWKESNIPHGTGKLTCNNHVNTNTSPLQVAATYANNNNNNNASLSLLYADILSYDGGWKRGVWHGHGQLLFANGDVYTGEFEEARGGTRHGMGCYEWANGRTYTGNFYENERHGHGTFLYTNSAKYVGNFVKGQRSGRGEYTIFVKNADGNGGGLSTTYQGEWEDGMYNGHG